MQRLHRIGRGKDLETLLRRGRRFSSELFQASALRNDLRHDRFAFVVARAVDKRATVRNRLRRRMRERNSIPALSQKNMKVALVFQYAD